MFITAVCFMFLIKLRWPITKSLYDISTMLCLFLCPVKTSIQFTRNVFLLLFFSDFVYWRALQYIKMRWNGRIISYWRENDTSDYFLDTTPYFINYYILHLGHITSNVQQAISDFHSKTCVRFVNYYSGYHKNYIEFSNNDGYATIFF